jgi:transcriptional regulator with GAF, ATPase, and Fis domain
MASDMFAHVDYQFVASLLLELAQERSPQQVLQKVVRRSLEGAPALIVVAWLVEEEEETPADVSSGREGPTSGRWLYAVAGGMSSSAGACAEPHRLPDCLARIPVGVGPIGRMATTRESLSASDLDKDPGELATMADWLRENRIRGAMGHPMVCNDEVLGVVAAFGRTNLPEEARRWGRVIVDHTAGALANARAFEEIQRLRAQLEQHNAYLREEVVEAKAFGDLVGHSAALGQVIQQIDLVAPTDASVLIQGETGTGKELVAHEVHCRSQRRGKPLIRVNCASVPKDLYESEFFGHVKGAFTGAIRDRAGRFETAEGGTLFLDEIAEVPLGLQSKLLRVLQEKRYERVGEDVTRRADVRIIAATNRDLKQEVDAGRFRADLYYRLNVFPIHVSPLRERKEDIPLLARHFVQRSVTELRCPRPRLTRAGVARLESYDWPGNVRELQNVIERGVILARGGVLEFDLPICDAPPAARADPRPADDEPEFLTEVQLRTLERENLLAVLEKTHGKVRGAGGAAELLGVNPATLLSRMRVMGPKRPK